LTQLTLVKSYLFHFRTGVRENGNSNCCHWGPGLTWYFSPRRMERPRRQADLTTWMTGNVARLNLFMWTVFIKSP